MCSVELRVLGVVLAVVVGVGCGVDARIYEPVPPGPPILKTPRNGAYLSSLDAPSLRPSFAWHPSVSGTNAVHYELQYSADESFAAALTTGPIAGTEYRVDAPLDVALTPPVGRRYYWRARACVQTVCSDFSKPWHFDLGRIERDLNGDGYADLIVGAPSSSAGGADAGRAYVYLSRAGSMDAVADGVITGAAGDRLGTSVAILGDVNGDGFADMAVGAPGDDQDGIDAGAVRIFLGGAGATFDAVTDMRIAGESAGSFLGESLIGPGDLNGDGYADAIAGAPGESSSMGRVYVHLGGPGDALSARRAKLQGVAAGEKFGTTLSAVGDVDGDGMADIVVNRGRSAASCSSTLYLGGAGTLFDMYPDQEYLMPSSTACELVVSGAGDVNADGRQDLAAVTRHPFGGDLLVGEAYVYVMPETLVASIDVANAAKLISSSENRVYSMNSVGDVNGDGYDDVVANQLTNGTVYLGRANGALSLEAAGTLPLAGLISVASAGDVNGDGVDDIVAGCVAQAGAAYLYFGGMGSTFDTAVDGTFTDGVSNTGFGYSVSAAPLAARRTEST